MQNFLCASRFQVFNGGGVTVETVAVGALEQRHELTIHAHQCCLGSLLFVVY